MAVLDALAGAALVLLVLVDTFEAVVLPRRVTRPYRFARVYYRTAWRAWSALACRLSAARSRQSLLGVFGPLSLLALFTLWAVGLVVGFGLLHYAFAPDGRTLGENIYLSGTTFTTLGYGDVTPSGPADRVLAVAEALIGFGFLAIVIGYLPVFYQAFSRREVTISLLDARAGSPPSAGEMLLRLPPDKGTALSRFLEEAERWAAEVLEGQLSYPVLSYYRSQHDNQSWLATLACSLDVSALLLTVVRGADTQQPRLTFAMARHAAVDLGLVFQTPARPPAHDRLPETDFARLRQTLATVGLPMREVATSVKGLTELRELYEPFVAALAAYFQFALPPFQPEKPPVDNWQTSPWTKRSPGLGGLAGGEEVH